jgi:tetratricopeptide (TPR) repeat protein
LQCAKIPPKDGLSEEATYNAILSLDNLTSRSKKITKYSKEEAKTVDSTPKDLTLPEEKFIETARYYIAEYPSGKNAGDIMFRAGVIYYQKNQFEKANEEFRKLIKERPQHKTAQTAAHLVLDMYNIRKDYPGLTEQAQAFFQQANLGDAKFKAEMKQIMGEVDFKQIEGLEKEDKWNEAGEAYFRFFQNNPKADLAEKALYNAFVSFDKSGNTVKSSEMARVFVAKYPKSDYSAKMILHLAKAAEKHFDFEQAQRFFLDYSERFPKEKEAKKALYNAAVFSELLEKNKEAQSLYERYLKEGATSDDERRAIQVSLSKIYRKEGNWEKVKAIYRQLANESKSQEERLRVLAELTRIYERAGKEKEKQDLVKELRSKMDPKSKSSLGLASFYVAEAQFNSLKNQRESYQKIKLRFPPDVFVATLKKKQKALAKLASSYDDVVEFGVPDWGVAALFEKGEAYQELVSAFRAVTIPKSYKAEERTELESALKAIDEKDIVPIEKAGKEIWEACAKRASEFKVVNTYAEKCRAKTGNSETLGLFPKGKYWSYSFLSEKELKNSPQTAPSMDDKDEYLTYLGQLAEKKEPKLEGLLKAYLYRYPEEKRAVFLLAVEYLRTKRKELANYFFNQLEKDPKFEWRSWIQNNLGVLAWQEKNRYQAQDFFEKATDQKPATPYAALNLGILYLEGYGFKDSVSLFEKAASSLPQNEEAALGLGLSLEGVGRFEEAGKAYQRYTSENPNATQILFNYAVLLGNRLKQREQAAQIMLRYIQRGGKESGRAHEIIKSWR